MSSSYLYVSSWSAQLPLRRQLSLRSWSAQTAKRAQSRPREINNLHTLARSCAQERSISYLLTIACALFARTPGVYAWNEDQSLKYYLKGGRRDETPRP